MPDMGYIWQRAPIVPQVDMAMSAIGEFTRMATSMSSAAKGFRVLSSPLRLLPDFIIIGGQRCGTTSLYRYLVEHPDIAGARRKEVHFFDNSFHRGTRWYNAHFPLSLERRAREMRGHPLITGEASPYYLFHPHAPRRVRQLVPNAKLIALLRNPVDRAYSHYHLSVRLGFETLPFEQAIESEHERLNGELERMLADDKYYSRSHQHHSYLARGIYVDQLKIWLDTFPREQILILRSEDFYADPGPAIQQVTDFIGLNPYRKARYEVHNDGKYNSLSDDMRAFLYEYYAPHNERLNDYLGMDFGWNS